MSHEIFTEAQLSGPKNVLGYPETSFKSFSSEHQIFQSAKLDQTSVIESHPGHKKIHRRHK
jgi:hypothetical protein